MKKVRSAEKLDLIDNSLRGFLGFDLSIVLQVGVIEN